MHRVLFVLLLCVACSTSSSRTHSGDGGGLQVQVVTVEHVPAADLAKVVEEVLVSRPASAGGLRVVVEADRNVVVLRGTTAQIREALELVARLDTPAGR